MTAPTVPEVYAQEGWGAHEVGRSREPHNPVDDAQTKAFIDGWNARLDYDDFDKALHYWLLSGITHVGALPLAHPAASTPVTLYREIDALGGVSQGPWDDGYSAALTDVLLILMKRGFSEEQDIGAALPAHNINSYVDGYEDALEVAAHPAAPQGEEGDIAAIHAVTAQMRRFMPNACGDWADQIDAALGVPQPLTTAEHAELCGYLHGKDYRDNTVEAVAARQRRFEYLKQRHDRLAALAPAAIASGWEGAE